MNTRPKFTDYCFAVGITLFAFMIILGCGKTSTLSRVYNGSSSATLMGVAPLADLIFGDWDIKGSETYAEDWFADFFDSARTNGAAVTNMSFGSNTIDAE